MLGSIPGVRSDLAEWSAKEMTNHLHPSTSTHPTRPPPFEVSEIHKNKTGLVESGRVRYFLLSVRQYYQPRFGQYI